MEEHAFIGHNETLYDVQLEMQLIIPGTLISFAICMLNIVSVAVILKSRKLRRPSNYFILSLLLGATLQSAITGPSYAFKWSHEIKHVFRWLCDFGRVPYIFCGHILKVSLMLISFDRFVATFYPWQYPNVVTRKIVTTILITAWTITIAVDIVPFLPIGKEVDHEGCSYIPQRSWGITVITMFNVFPFFVIVFNYTMIWKVAYNITFKEYGLKASISSSKGEEGNENNDLLGKESKAKLMEVKGENSSKDEKPLRGFDRKKSDFTSRSSKQSYPSINDRKKIRLAWEMKATKTSLILLSVYIFCWGPLGVLYIIDHYCYNCISYEPHTQINRFIVKILSFLSSVLLPIVYCWRTKDFRREVLRLYSRERYRRKEFVEYFEKRKNKHHDERKSIQN